MKGIYIAGPQCFLENGYEMWWSRRKLAESRGFNVTMPTSTPLRQDADDRRDNAREIFDDLLVQAAAADVLIADLRSFRGPEPDGGTLFEMGMMKAAGASLYGFDSTMESVIGRNPYVSMIDGCPVDEKGYPYPYGCLPFPPSVCAMANLVEGGFDQALHAYEEDVRKAAMGVGNPMNRIPPLSRAVEKSVFFSSWHRYAPGWASICESVQEAFCAAGWQVVFPLVPDDWSDLAAVRRTTLENLDRISSCSAFIAELDDFRGYEPSGDVAFESGFAFGLGRRCLGFLSDMRRMRDRIPGHDGMDAHGHIIENFDLPINLMFSCSMQIYRAGIEDMQAHVQRLLQLA